MVTKIAAVVSLLCFILSAAALGQGYTQGDKDVVLSGSGASSNDFDSTVFSIEGYLGYFFTDNIEGMIRQGVGYSDVPGSDDNWNASTRAALDLHFDLGRWWPFVGANIGYIYGDQVHDTWVAGPEGGLKYFVNETTYILGMIEYEFFFDNGDSIDDAFDDGRFVYVVGIGFRW
ncbi:MAG: hypothetical protein ACM3VT_14570 [Solirubrobacterales bacterium]